MIGEEQDGPPSAFDQPHVAAHVLIGPVCMDLWWFRGTNVQCSRCSRGDWLPLIRHLGPVCTASV